MKNATIRLGFDIGGTFTDVVLEKDGVPFSTKVLTTYAAPENAIIDGMLKWSGKTGQRAKMYPTMTTGYRNDEETQFFG